MNLRDVQSFREQFNVKGASNVRSSFLAVSRSICCIISALVCECRTQVAKAYFDKAWVRHDRFQVYSIDERFTESNILDAGVVKPVDIIPDCGVIVSVSCRR